MTSLNTCREIKLHVVAQIIKSEFVVRAVSDVRVVGGLTLEVVHVILDTADFQTQETVNLAHPLSVARSEIIVHGHDVHAAASQGIQISRQSGHQRLSLAGAHFRNLALVKY